MPENLTEQEWREANYRNIIVPKKKSLEPPIDPLVSKVVGKKVLARDPRLINLVAKWQNNRKKGDDVPDNYLNDPEKIKELKETFT